MTTTPTIRAGGTSPPSPVRARGASPWSLAARIADVTGLAPRALVALSIVSILNSGCVRRTIKITTEPPSARVFLNDQEIGRSEVTTDFLWYGDYDVTIRKEGYQTLQTNWTIKAPWYQWVPFDFFAEVLWPGQIHDEHERHFVLEEARTPTQEELVGRAVETRDRALETRK